MNALQIYHICTAASWSQQEHASFYIHDSLQDEKFIHCSEEHQIAGVLQRYFKNQTNLMILTIDVSRLQPKLKYEMAPIGQYFPHIYGPINKDAIMKAKKIRIAD